MSVRRGQFVIPVSGAVIVRTGTAHYEDGEVMPRFRRTVAALLKRRAGDCATVGYSRRRQRGRG